MHLFHRYVVCAALLMGLLLSGAAHAQDQQVPLPSLGEVGDLSLGDERRLGARIVGDLYASGDVGTDVVLAQYIDNIWQALFAAGIERGDISPEMAQQLAWQVLLIDDAGVNAFALPGGYLGVNMGLIAMADDVHALASVLAHELSHVTQRHIARIISLREQNAPWLLAAMIVGSLAVTHDTGLANAAILGGQAAAAQSQLNFSRDMEREADRQGLQVQNLAGFDAAGFARMFAQLQNVNRLNDDGAFPYLRSHPLTSQRIADMQLRLVDLRPPARGLLQADWLDPDVQAFMRARAHVLVQTRQDSLQAWVDLAGKQAAGNNNPVVSYQGALAAAALQQHALAWRWLEHLSARVPASNKALTALLQASAVQVWVGMPPANRPASFNGEAMAQLSMKLLQHFAGASASVRRSRRSELLSAAAAAGVSSWQTWAAVQDQADQLLRLWLVDHSTDAQAWQIAGNLAQAMRQPLRALRAQAEYAAHTGQLEAAKDRFMAAQAFANQHPSNNDQEAAIVAVRLQQVATEWRAQQADNQR